MVVFPAASSPSILHRDRSVDGSAEHVCEVRGMEAFTSRGHLSGDVARPFPPLYKSYMVWLHSRQMCRKSLVCPLKHLYPRHVFRLVHSVAIYLQNSLLLLPSQRRQRVQDPRQQASHAD
jgi:hypothetical protein